MVQKPYVGIWVDHRQALLFWMDEKAETEITEINSGYQEEGEPTDSMGNPNTFVGAVAHASVEQRRKEQLKRFYKKLDRNLRTAGHIYIFGPGQAKKELASTLQKDKAFKSVIKGIENADKKMTRPEMAARVREKFGLPKENVA